MVSQNVASFAVTALVNGTALTANSSISSGTTVEIQASAQDASGNFVSGYSDTVTIVDNFSLAQKCYYTMSNGVLDVFVTLSGDGSDTIVVTSYTNNSITGSSATFSITLVFS